MYIKSFKLDKNKRLWIIMFGAVIVALILIGATTCFLGSNTIDKNKLKDNAEHDLFNLTSYMAKYEVNVIGNKTKNRYDIYEWYEKKDAFESYRFQTQNEQGNVITYVLNGNELSIRSDMQKLEYKLTDYFVKKENLISLSTFIQMYKDVEENLKCRNDSLEKCFKIENELIDNIVYYKIIINKELCKKDYCTVCEKYQEILNDGNGVSKLELAINKSNNIPTEYIIYNKKGDAFIDVLYSFIHINECFDEKVFAFFDK
ncbi:MAG: hypothetical protein RSE00_05645 [Clostridia bacterium]